MKIAPLVRACREAGGIESVIVHTGQHYDERMSQLFFDDLEIPRPDLHLGVGSASHAVQTARIMERFEPVLEEVRPDLVVVVGDVNSTAACALTAVKVGIAVAHVEAGLRSFDRSMPEEINRVVTDAVSELLFASEPSGVRNLRREGHPEERIHFVGNVMIDTLLQHRRRAAASDILDRLGLEAGAYAVVTLHRPSNVDDGDVFGRILDALEEIQREVPVVFPAHPRTQQMLKRLGLEARLARMPGLRVMEPLGYLDFLRLMSDARVVLTDSGGIQEETTILGVPCLTLRANTERPITIEQGTNRLVGTDPVRIVAGYREAVCGARRGGVVPEKWDGRAAERIVAVIRQWAARRGEV